MNRSVRAAAWICLVWAVINIGWAAYNCFGQVGLATFVKGVFYFGYSDQTGRVDSSSVTAAVLFPLAGIGLSRGWSWARGYAVGIAAVGAYNWLRGTTGALFDPEQRPWFTGQIQGQLRLATMVLGCLVLVALVLLVRRDRSAGATPWQPAPNAWTVAAQQVVQGGPALPPQSPYAQAPALPGAGGYPQGYSVAPGGAAAGPAGYGYPAAAPQVNPYGGGVVPNQPQGYASPQQPVPSAYPSVAPPTPTVRTYPVLQEPAPAGSVVVPPPPVPSPPAPQDARPVAGQLPTLALGYTPPPTESGEGGADGANPPSSD